MRFHARLAIGLLAVPFASGCGAVVARVDQYDRAGSLALFSGAILDAHVAAGIGDKDVLLMMPEPQWLWRPAAVIDLIPSLALDVVLAPVDALVWLFSAKPNPAQPTTGS